MKVVQTVFGVFHHFELARQLERRGYLDTIYSTFPWRRLKREGLDHAKVNTFPWIHTPEMLIQRFGFHPAYLLDQMSYANAVAFDRWTSARVARRERPDVLIGLSGSSLKTGRELQSRGGSFICDRGSSHQRYQEQIVSEEYALWGVSRAVSDIRDILREEAIYASADQITVPSHFAARSFVESGVSADKLTVIPYGVRLEKFSPLGKPEVSRFDVLFAGSVSLRKGVPYLLQAFAKLTHSAKRLRIAGAMHPDMANVLDRLPKEQVDFLGPVNQERLRELMSTSHVLVLPSIEEGLALVQGQALACGCPVIASTNTGAEDLFSDGIEGFIVAIRDVSALHLRMQMLAEDPELQRRMSEAALRRVQHLGGWDDYGDRWVALLDRLVKNKRPDSYASPAPPPTK